MTDRAPLEGLRILDLTRLLPGPLCAQHLADLGADVLKIEDTEAGDYAPPSLRAQVNRNKRSLRLNLKQAEGREVFLRLADEADVLIESFRPGIAERLGIDYPRLAERNPRLVYCSISGYGQDSPLRQQPGHDLNYCAAVGVAEQIGSADGQPGLSNVPLADLMGGTLTAGLGILAALFDARRSGHGRYLDIAMSDGVFAHAVMPLARHNESGSARGVGADTLTGALPCYGLYRTADARFMAVGALEAKFWRLLCEVLEREDLIASHRSADAGENARVSGELQRLFATRSQAEWIERFAGVECCVSPVLSFEEALQGQVLRSRQMLLHSEHPHYGAQLLAGCPVKMSGFTFALRRHAPLAGEQSREVLAEAGYDAGQIDALFHSGAVA